MAALLMRRPHTGRAGTAVIPDGWAAHHRPAAGATHTAECSIRRPGAASAGGINPATGVKNLSTHAPHYTGPCSYSPKARSAGADLIAADESIPTYDVVVGLGFDAAPLLAAGDIVTITDPGPGGDPSTVGTELRVEFIDRDSLSIEQLVLCSEDQS